MNQQELIDKIFSPGSRVMLEYVDDQKMIKSCSTLIEDLEGVYLVLQAPVVENVALVFRESQELTLRRLDAQKEEAYVTNVFVVDIRQGKIPMLVCSKPKKIDKTSLRRFSRFGVKLPFIYKNSANGLSGSGYINDLSLNGCYALTDKDPEVDKDVVLNLIVSFPDEEDLDIDVQVIRVDLLRERGMVGLAINYHEISEAIKEFIYNYIFQLQLTSDRYFGFRPDSDGR